MNEQRKENEDEEEEIKRESIQGDVRIEYDISITNSKYTGLGCFYVRRIKNGSNYKMQLVSETFPTNHLPN